MSIKDDTGRTMPSEIMNDGDFLKVFRGEIDYQHGADPLFGLILGSGASRSAGIPVAGEMVRALKQLAKLRNLRLGEGPKRKSELSWYFRKYFRTGMRHRPH